jgi:hypothetical protein
VIKQVLILVGAAATTAGVVAAVTLPGEAQQRAAQTGAYVLEKSTPPIFDSSYTAGMRIIHVPQAGVSRTRAAAPSYREDTADETADVTPAPQAHRRLTGPQPRRVLPPAAETKRTMLNPPKALHDGPSPVRPLPRWRDIEKFTELPKPVTSAPPVADAAAKPIPTAGASNPAVIGDNTPPPAN